MNWHEAAFEEVVKDCFHPIAAKAKLGITRIGDGIYELAGSDFTMRIRRGTGHDKSILVTLLRTRDRPADPEDLSKELGLGVFLRFRGLYPPMPTGSDREAYFADARVAARDAEQYLLPYLRGDRCDFGRIREFAKERGRKRAQEFRAMTFPENFKAKWKEEET